MFFSQKLKKFKNLKHCFFSRNGGVSKGMFNSLNCGIGSKDKKVNVLKNLEIVSQIIGCQNENLITLNQIHSDKVIYFGEQNLIKNKMSGDAIVTKVNKVGIGVLTADCVPIFFYDPKNKVIGCTHSGWKGALNGIVTNTIGKFIEINSKTENIVAAVGPCIKKSSYEVGKDLYEKFISKNKKNNIFFESKDKNKFFFDLRGFINNELQNLNIKQIDNIEIDTFTEKNTFFSYRRSLFNKEEDYGRCISVILMT